MANAKSYTRMLRSMKKEWKWLLRYVMRYKGSIFLYIVLGITGTVISLSVSVASKQLIDAVISHSENALVKYGAIVIGLAVLKILLQSLASWFGAHVGTRTNNEIREEIYSHILKADTEQIGLFHSGDLLNRIEGDVATVSSGVISFIPGVFTRSLQFFGSLAIVLYYDKTMAVLALLSAPLLFLSSRYLMRTMRRYNEKSRELNGEVLSYSEESLQNIQFIKAFDLTKQYISNFREILSSYRRVTLSYQKFSILITMALSFTGLVVAYACYGWGVYRLWQGAITYGTMTLFLQISGGLSSSFASLVSLVPSAVTMATSAGRIMEVTAYETENDRDMEKAIAMLRRSRGQGIGIVAEHVAFTYRDSETTVLRKINFSVSPGETIALVGASGEGKTTLLKLLLGLIRPVSGRLYIRTADGNTLDISDSTRRFFSYVPQNVNLFSGTIRENLLLANPEATEEELMKVINEVELGYFISSQPEGLDTVIGEHGAYLSQGEGQRIAIARALLKEAAVIVMDEATSALDVITEERVLNNIMKADPNKVCIITTHRESMLKYCDRIYRISAGGFLSETNGIIPKTEDI